MLENTNIPESVSGINTKIYLYESPKDALITYASIPERLKTEMADVYREAFGGSPWFEKYKCGDCGNFAAGNECCPNCQSQNMGEAYPKKELTEKYFPQMLQEFTPGLLIIASNQSGKIVGFTTGGAITLSELIQKKYKGNPTILRSITDTTGIGQEDIVFYDNETCISPDAQQKGIGTTLSRERIALADQIGFPICGRTINRPWLQVKNRQLGQLGYQVQSFIPTGDNYQVEGNSRTFYLAKKT